MPNPSSIAEAREELLGKSRQLNQRLRKRREQMRLDRRRLGRVQDRLGDLIGLEHLGLVPGAGLAVDESGTPVMQIVAVQHGSVRVRLPDGKVRLMDAACLINLVAAEGAGVVPPPEETSVGSGG